VPEIAGVRGHQRRCVVFYFRRPSTESFPRDWASLRLWAWRRAARGRGLSRRHRLVHSRAVTRRDAAG
jgi:hypothetical protein